jgi:Flp pilus assembly protein TadG
MLKRNDSGQTLVEVAISLSVFLMLVLGTIDFGYMFSTKLTLQNAVRQAGRYAITGRCLTNPDGSCQQTRYNSIIQTVEDVSLGLAKPSEIVLTCTPNGGGCPNQAGGPGDIITITVIHPYNFMSGPIGALLHNTITLTVSSAFQNEAFLPSQS